LGFVGDESMYSRESAQSDIWPCALVKMSNPLPLLAFEELIVSTPSENENDDGVTTPLKLAPNGVGTVNEPEMKSLVVKGDEAVVNLFPVYV
jgi:hypothetical protein